MISITVTSVEGRTAEAGVVGSREMVGINAFMGGRETTQTEYVAKIPGEVVTIPAAALRPEFDASKRVRDVLLKYTQAMIAHLSQNVACNRLHSAEQRFGRWLLEVRDRIGSDDLRLTHEFIGEMLGIRRAGVTEIANRFDAAGIIKHSRRLVRIIDVEALNAAACGCYRTVTDEYERLLGPLGPAGDHARMPGKRSRTSRRSL